MSRIGNNWKESTTDSNVIISPRPSIAGGKVIGRCWYWHCRSVCDRPNPRNMIPSAAPSMSVMSLSPEEECIKVVEEDVHIQWFMSFSLFYRTDPLSHRSSWSPTAVVNMIWNVCLEHRSVDRVLRLPPKKCATKKGESLPLNQHHRSRTRGRWSRGISLEMRKQ